MLLREERFVALLKQRIFQRLPVDDLNIISDISRERRFKAGETVVQAQGYLPFLLIAVDGHLEFEDGTICTASSQLRYLMASKPLDQAIMCRGSDITCLSISRSHLFTLLQNCIGLSEGIMLEIVEQRKEGEHAH